MPTPTEVAWAAGLFEGEGCIYGGYGNGKTYRMLVYLGTTDLDVLHRFMAVVESTAKVRERPPGTGGSRPLFYWQVGGSAEVRRIIHLLLPYFGERRRAKAEEVLRDGAHVGQAKPVGTHCKNGHLRTEPNTERWTQKVTLVGGEVSEQRRSRCRRCAVDRRRESRRAKSGKGQACLDIYAT